MTHCDVPRESMTIERPRLSAVEVTRVRRLLGLTREAFAFAIGVTLTAVERWERGVSAPTKEASVEVVRVAKERGLVVEVAR